MGRMRRPESAKWKQARDRKGVVLRTGIQGEGGWAEYGLGSSGFLYMPAVISITTERIDFGDAQAGVHRLLFYPQQCLPQRSVLVPCKVRMVSDKERHTFSEAFHLPIQYLQNAVQ